MVPGEWKKLMDFQWELSSGIINVLFSNANRISALNSSIFTYCVQSVSCGTGKINQASLLTLCPQFPQMFSDLFYKRELRWQKVQSYIHPIFTFYFHW